MFDWRKEAQTTLKSDDTVSGIAGERVYLVTSKKEEGFPRIVIREEFNEPSIYGDGAAWEAHIRLRLWIWAKTYEEWVSLIDAVNDAMTGEKWSRVSVGEDDYVPGANVYEKSVLYMRTRARRQ